MNIYEITPFTVLMLNKPVLNLFKICSHTFDDPGLVDLSED